MENTKICSKCGRELPLECFSKDRTSKDGLQYWCKECKKQHNKQWYADNREYILAQQKQYGAERYATLEGYAYNIRHRNLQEDRKHGRCGKDEDPLPSIEYYVWALQQLDFYDGKQYHWSEMGLDRIYNDKPHTFANVVPCSTKNNVRRHTMPFEEFVGLMKKEKEEGLELVL